MDRPIEPTAPTLRVHHVRPPGDRSDADPSPDDVRAVFRALGNTTRREILEMLHRHGGTMTSQRIAEPFGMTWQAISRHLRVLTEAGLISYAEHGRDRAYSLTEDRLQHVAGGWITTLDDGD